MERWNKALARFRAAEAALEAAQGEDDEVFSDALVALNDALKRLLRVPAPGFAAFALKVELSVEHEAATLIGSEPAMAALRRDARRLAAALR